MFKWNKNFFGFVLFFCFNSSVFSNETVVEKRFYSQCGQDRYVYNNFFKDKRDGIFIDIGAHDGISFSNTYFFEKELGWKGLCVEPIPDIFAKLQVYRKAICVMGCICNNSSEEVEFLRIFGDPAHLEMLSGIIDNYDPRHLEKIRKRLVDMKASSEVLKVKCYNFNELLSLHEIFHVDYLSLDTEGGELDILQSIDFSKFKIDVISVENNYGSKDFESFLQSVGYQKIAVMEQDEIYKLNSKM